MSDCIFCLSDNLSALELEYLFWAALVFGIIMVALYTWNTYWFSYHLRQDDYHKGQLGKMAGLK